MDGNQYFFELNPNDVLCGRGSGPNDHVGNIEFRNLALTRKAEYLAAASRDTKRHISNDIIIAVLSGGGHFMRKLSPKQTTNAGFKRGRNVFELADVATVLEKTRQALRNNRAQFLKENFDVVDVNMGDSSPAPTINCTPSPEPTNDVEHEMTPQPFPAMPSNVSFSIAGPWDDPLPLSDSAGLDLSARSAELISRAIFSLSDTSFTNPNRVVENNHLMSTDESRTSFQFNGNGINT